MPAEAERRRPHAAMSRRPCEPQELASPQERGDSPTRRKVRKSPQLPSEAIPRTDDARRPGRRGQAKISDIAGPGYSYPWLGVGVRFRPEDRLSSEDALLHAYCNVFHDPSAADPATNNVDTKGFPDNTKLQVKEYREALYKMVEDSAAKSEQGMGGTSKRSHRHTPSRKESRRGV